MLRRYFVPALLVVSMVLVASGCKKVEDDKSSKRFSDEQKKEVIEGKVEKETITQDQEVSVTLIGPKEEADVPPMPDPLSAEEAAKYKADLSLEERTKLAKELSVIQPKDGFNQLKAMFSDLKKVKTIPDSEKTNMMKMGNEEWFYSEEGGFTAVNCVMVNTPIYIFDKKDPTDQDVEAGMEEMKKMMKEANEKKN